MAKKKKLLVLTCGGDSAGTNTAVKWIVKKAEESKIVDEIIGGRYGWACLMENFNEIIDGNHERYESLDQLKVRYWSLEGGTKLKTSRVRPFQDDEDPDLGRIVDRLNDEKEGFDYVVALGGDGTHTAAHYLAKRGVKIIGIPQTIDNDIPGTDYSLGFESAVSVNLDIIHKLRVTGSSHRMICLVQVMGRTAGHIGLRTGEAGDAAAILIPEHPFRMGELVERLVNRRNYAEGEIIVVSEGACVTDGPDVFKPGRYDGKKRDDSGGVASFIARELNRVTGYETRSNMIGHAQRGSSPCYTDMQLGRRYGMEAVELLKSQNFGQMVCSISGIVSHTPLDVILNGPSHVNIGRDYDTQRLTAKRNPQSPLHK